MAKFKALRDGEMQMYTDIENRLIDLATMKGAAFEDDSMEEKEREIESDMEERGINNVDNNYGRRSNNSELLGSVNSSQDFWQKIERQ